MTTKSTEEAMGVLNATRPDYIAIGREIAIKLAGMFGEVHSRQVRDVMEKLGYLGKFENEKDFWLGSVFRNEAFEWTGKYHTYSDPERNIHERTVKVWRLKAP